MKSCKAPGNVFDRHLRIDSVLVQDVDAVSPEALRHLLDDLADVVGHRPRRLQHRAEEVARCRRKHDVEDVDI
jgi:hypothetical protein